jgi:hypothetical protein
MELNLGVLDDYSKGRAEANSKLLRDKTWDWFTDDFMARFAQESAMLILCTRWHIDDVIGRYKLKFPSLREIKFSAVAEQDEEHRRKGEALFPEHKSLAFLLERKALMTEVSWQSEYQQKPYLSEGGMFPIGKFQTLAFFDRKDVAQSVLGVDKAGTIGGGPNGDRDTVEACSLILGRPVKNFRSTGRKKSSTPSGSPTLRN